MDKKHASVSSKPSPASGDSSATGFKSLVSKVNPTTTNNSTKLTSIATTVNAAAAAAARVSSASQPVVVHEKNLKEIAEILSHEIANESDPISYLVIDENERIQAFLRNRDGNYISLIDPNSFQPERIRVAIIGSLRFDKLLIFGIFG